MDKTLLQLIITIAIIQVIRKTDKLVFFKNNLINNAHQMSHFLNGIRTLPPKDTTAANRHLGLYGLEWGFQWPPCKTSTKTPAIFGLEIS